jgi:hypothetical protein
MQKSLSFNLYLFFILASFSNISLGMDDTTSSSCVCFNVTKNKTPYFANGTYYQLQDSSLVRKINTDRYIFTKESDVNKMVLKTFTLSFVAGVCCRNILSKCTTCCNDQCEKSNNNKKK